MPPVHRLQAKKKKKCNEWKPWLLSVSFFFFLPCFLSLPFHVYVHYKLQTHSFSVYSGYICEETDFKKLRERASREKERKRGVRRELRVLQKVDRRMKIYRSAFNFCGWLLLWHQFMVVHISLKKNEEIRLLHAGVAQCGCLLTAIYHHIQTRRTCSTRRQGQRGFQPSQRANLLPLSSSLSPFPRSFLNICGFRAFPHVCRPITLVLSGSDIFVQHRRISSCRTNSFKRKHKCFESIGAATTHLHSSTFNPSRS